MLPAGLHAVESSVATVDGATYAAIEPGSLALLGDAEQLDEFEGIASEWNGKRLLVGPRSHANLRALSGRLPWLRPKPLGLQPSVGFGDRLGVATPGHIAAMRSHGAGLNPIFAQQSIREMDRTQRIPREVVDDATWAVFASGWREPGDRRGRCHAFGHQVRSCHRAHMQACLSRSRGFGVDGLGTGVCRR
jgi:hypothetical protein